MARVQHPTLVTPLSLFVGGYWLCIYALQIGLCLILVVARSDETKDTLIRGLGIRFSIANWLSASPVPSLHQDHLLTSFILFTVAAWAVFFTMQYSWSFLAAEVCVVLNVINLCVLSPLLVPVNL